MTTVLKLGGSVVTHKDQPEAIDRETLKWVAETIADHLNGDSGDAVEDLVVVHGAGSFGHHHAAEHGVSTTEGSHDAAGLAAIHGAMTDLSDAIVAALQDRSVGALPVRPLSVAHRDADGTLALPSDHVETMLEEGFVPVLHGDVVVHEGKGGTILSGDEVVTSLAASLSADRVGLCSTVPGVLDEEGEVVSEITAYDEVAAVLGESAATDVTGGMAGKVRALLDLEVPASIFDPDGLASFLRGESVGTVVRGG